MNLFLPQKPQPFDNSAINGFYNRFTNPLNSLLRDYERNELEDLGVIDGYVSLRDPQSDEVIKIKGSCDSFTLSSLVFPARVMGEELINFFRDSYSVYKNENISVFLKAFGILPNAIACISIPQVLLLSATLGAGAFGLSALRQGVNEILFGGLTCFYEKTQSIDVLHEDILKNGIESIDQKKLSKVQMYLLIKKHLAYVYAIVNDPNHPDRKNPNKLQNCLDLMNKFARWYLKLSDHSLKNRIFPHLTSAQQKRLLFWFKKSIKPQFNAVHQISQKSIYTYLHGQINKIMT